MPSLPDWLPEMVRASLVAEKLRGESEQWLRESNGLLLYGTIGHAAYLRADGSVWFHAPVDRIRDPDRYEWREASPVERLGAINLGVKKHPESRELLPTRPANAPDCRRCSGRGSLFEEVQCPDCGGLGWIPHGAV